MPETRLAPISLEGWYTLHQGFRLAWPRWKSLAPEEREEQVREMEHLLSGWSDLGRDGWSGLYRMVGSGLDFMLVHFRSDLGALGDAERAVAGTGLGDLLYLEMDYLSVVELGLYRVTAGVVGRLRAEGIDPTSEEGRAALREAAEEHRELDYVQDRLYPGQPDGMPYLCFYPMDKRRNPGQNWYTLPLEERNALMAEHGKVGRRYAGRVSQVITGSVGLDDWEWGVTLFSGDPVIFKDLVTEMRYDEASSKYAEFGPFYVGERLPARGLEGALV